MSRSPQALGDVPTDVQDQVKSLLSVSPDLRPDAHQISKVCTVLLHEATQTAQALSKSRILNTKARKVFFARSTLKKLFLSQPCELICSHTPPADAMRSESFGWVAMPYFKPYCRAQYCSLVSLVFVKFIIILLGFGHTTKEHQCIYNYIFSV